MFEEPTNEDRASWAMKACQAFVEGTRHAKGEREAWASGQVDRDMVQEVIGDLICDLLHLASEYQLDVSSLAKAGFASWALESFEAAGTEPGASEFSSYGDRKSH